MSHPIPIITIDGPSGVGKGTIASALAKKLGWQVLDSGAIYRVLALAALHHQVDIENEANLVPLAAHLDVQFLAQQQTSLQVVLEGEEVTQAIRNEQVGNTASKIAVFPRVREALLRRQRAFAQQPGLIADGRDMGTVVFPEAAVKIFLDASAQERAKRRWQQLQQQGISGSFDALLVEIKARDERDRNRIVAPLVPAKEALVIDSTAMTIEQVFDTVIKYVKKQLPSVLI